MSTASPPRTPPIAPRIPSTSPSDDSSIIELSFDYEFDSAGNYVRVSKGSSGSSPPTPVELDNPRRHALSKSVTLDPVTVTGATAARSFQRVASGPAALTPAASAASARKLSRPQRIPLSIDEQPQDDWELRVQQDEKENILNIINSDSDNQQPPPQKRTSPHLTARSQPDGRAISALPTRAYSSSRQPLQPGRQILPGPNRAGRILMGVKYTPIDKINEHEQLDPGEETDTSPDEPISAAPGIARHRSYGAVVQPITRPRRSASLSDAGAGSLSESGGEASPRLHSTYSRPGSSLSMNSSRPRRVTAEQIQAGRPSTSTSWTCQACMLTNSDEAKDHCLVCETPRPYNDPSRATSASAASAGYPHETPNPYPQDSHPYTSNAYTQESYGANTYNSHPDAHPRQSPSPTHMAVSHLLRPSHAHQRRDSDTVRSLALGTSASSPTAVESKISVMDSRLPIPSEHVPSRLSPTGRSHAQYLSQAASQNQGYHRRSPTAPEAPTSSGLVPSTTSTAVGELELRRTSGEHEPKRRSEEYEKRTSGEHEPKRTSGEHEIKRTSGDLDLKREKERERERDRESKERAAPPPPAPVPVRNHNICVNKKVYARLDLVGKGGSSRVYRVMNSSNAIYAIKRVSLDKTDAETMKGYMNEIGLLKRLAGNKRIIQLFDSEVRPGGSGGQGSKGYLMLVMECGEVDLAKLLAEQQKEPLDMVWVGYYWQQMLQAVHVIHEEKIVHSDLKPANFVLVRGQLKLIDFGIANAIANDTTNIQRDHQIGTVNYMSPEAIELPDGMRRLKVGRPSDVWSLGCILYQMIYGQPPFQHLSVYQKMKAIPDCTHEIAFPEWSERGCGEGEANIEGKRVRVRKDVIRTMKMCLERNPKERAVIPELLEHAWLSGGADECPAPQPAQQPEKTARELLGPEETIINPYYMKQLLEYGIKLGQQAQSGEIDQAHLEREAERLVAELKALDS